MNKNYRNDVVTFVLFFILCLIGLMVADLVGHNGAGSYIGPISFEEIDWIHNGIVSLIGALISMLALHKSTKNDD